MNYKNIITIVSISLFLGSAISCTSNKNTKSTDSVNNDSVANVGNAEEIDTTIYSPKVTKKGNNEIFSFNKDGKEWKLSTDGETCTIEANGKKFPMKNSDGWILDIDDCRLYKNKIWFIAQFDFAGERALKEGVGICSFDTDKNKFLKVHYCGGAKFKNKSIRYLEEYAKGGRGNSVAETDFVDFPIMLSLDDPDKAPSEKEIISFIKNMYNKEVYWDESFINTHCTKKLIKRLLNEGYGEGDYGAQIFRSGAEDGPSDKYGIIDVKPLGDSWYKYTYYDMGIKGANKIKVVLDGATIKFDQIVKL